MTREEHKQIITQLMGMITPEHQADASLILTNLSDDYEETLTTTETANGKVEQMVKDNETLRSVNAKLFLRVGETEKLATQNTTQQADEKTKETEQDFGDLFDEKGDLK